MYLVNWSDIIYIYSLSTITWNFVKRYIRDTFERYKCEFAIKRSTKRRTPNCAPRRNIIAHYVKKRERRKKMKGYYIHIYVYETVRHVQWRMTNITAINQHFRSIVRKKRASPQMLLPFVLRCLNTVHGISSLSLSLFNEIAPGQQPDFSTRKTRSHGAPQSNRVETRDQTFVIRTDAAEMSTGTINAAPRCIACPTGTMGIPSDWRLSDWPSIYYAFREQRWLRNCTMEMEAPDESCSSLNARNFSSNGLQGRRIFWLGFSRSKDSRHWIFPIFLWIVRKLYKIFDGIVR